MQELRNFIFIRRHIFAVTLAPLIGLLLVGCGSGVACGTAGISIPGPMPKKGAKMSISSVQQNSTGFLTESSYQFDPPTLYAKICGAQHFRFKYSTNITEVRISLGDELLYKGPPIEFIDASMKPKNQINVEFAWAGNDAQVLIAND